MKKIQILLICCFFMKVCIQSAQAQDTLHLKMFTQGYYLGSGQMQPVEYNEGVCSSCTNQVDTFFAEVHNGTSPYGIVGGAVPFLLQVDGTGTVLFPPSVAGHSYYIAIRHRNTLQTWSKLPYSFAATGNSYDFTTAASQAYGDNMVLVDTGPNRWAFYTGDINQDGNIDLFDFILLWNDINHGIYGYYASDLNGDGNTDLLDFPIWDSNMNSGIYTHHP